jgi:glycosyltransferase involved in cell wall biosynthesis
MKVLVTASTLPRWSGDALPAFVLDQVVALRNAFPQIEAVILAPHHAGAARREAMNGVEVRRFRYFWPAALEQLAYPAILPNIRRRWWLALQAPFLLVAEFFAILSHARRFRPDVIYSHWFMPQAVAGGLAACLLGVPHVFTSHSTDVEVLRRVPLLGTLLVRFITRRAHAYTVVSRRTGRKLEAFFTPAEWREIGRRLRVIPMGVDAASLAAAGPDMRRHSRAALGLGSEPTLLFLGRLTAKKGIADLLRAAALLAGEGRAFRLVIAGAGELGAALREQVRDLRLTDRVLLPGFVTGEQKRQCLAAADLLVLPSVITPDGDAEGLPVALLEGMAAGKVCIATDVSGADEVLTDGENGFIIPSGQPQALARAIARALDLGPGDRAAIGERAARRAAAFDWSAIAAAHHQHLLAGLPRGGPPAGR